jgi:hypothetical protein
VYPIIRHRLCIHSLPRWIGQRDETITALWSANTNVRQELERADMAQQIAACEKEITSLEAKIIEQRMTVDEHFDDLKENIDRCLAAESTQRDEIAKAFWSEITNVKREIERAADMATQLREMELHVGRMQAALDEAKRGPKGEKGDRGERGLRGEPGRNGRDGKDGAMVDVKTKRWEIDRENYTARRVLTDGTREPALQLRGLFEQFLHETAA